MPPTFRRSGAPSAASGSKIGLFCNGSTVFLDSSILLSSASRFKNDPALLTNPRFEIESEVSSEIFSTFVNALNYETCEITAENCSGLQRLATEFGFDELLRSCTDFSGETDGAAVVRICRLQKRIRDKTRQVNALREQLEELQEAVASLQPREDSGE
jgi:hypothetical protein